MNNLRVTKSKFVFFCFSILGLILAILSSLLLPKKYFSDAFTIINNPWDLGGFIGSFEFSIIFYSFTSIIYFPFPLVALIQYPIVIFILYKIYEPLCFDKIRVNNVLMYFSFFLLGVYLSMQSKEFITFLFCTLIVVIIKKKNHIIRNRIIICLLFVIFSIIFRTYFLIVLMISILFSLLHLSKITNNIYTMLVVGLIFTIFLTISYGFIKGDYMSDKYRTELNEGRLSDAKIRQQSNSAIIPPISTDTWYGESVSVLYGFIVVNIPFRSLFSLSPQIIVFSLWQLVLFIYLFFKFNKKLKLKENYNINWIFYLTFSFFIVQGLFEPDLGSSIKHKAGIFPLIYFMLFYDVDK